MTCPSSARLKGRPNFRSKTSAMARAMARLV